MIIEGTITVDGVATPFTINADGNYAQWGANTEVLGQRVDVLQRMAEATDEFRLSP